MRIALVVALVGCGSSTPRLDVPPPHLATPAVECHMPFPVVRRCIDPAQSPGEPYLVSLPGELEVVFKLAEGTARSTDPRDARVSRRSGIRDGILHNNVFALPCVDLPRGDGMYFVDLCPIGTPAAACAESVPATGTGVAEISGGTLALRTMAWGAAIQVSYSPDPEDPGCSISLSGRPPPI